MSKLKVKTEFTLSLMSNNGTEIDLMYRENTAINDVFQDIVGLTIESIGFEETSRLIYQEMLGYVDNK